jgi:hypothetical protein
LVRLSYIKKRVSLVLEILVPFFIIITVVLVEVTLQVNHVEVKTPSSSTGQLVALVLVAAPLVTTL